MLKIEQETIISFNAEEKTVHHATTDPREIARMDKLHRQFPEQYQRKIISKGYDENSQKSLVVRYIYDKKLLGRPRKPRAKREMTEEQKQKLILALKQGKEDSKNGCNNKN